MHISKFQVFNYKSYNDSTEIELKSGFNIITGQNNAGKTALLDALTLNFPARPHRSESTVPFRGAPVEQASSIFVRFVISGRELIQSLQSINSPVFFPRPNPNLPSPVGGTPFQSNQVEMDRVLQALLQQSEFGFPINFSRDVSRGESWHLDERSPNFLGFYQLEPPNPNNQNRLGYQAIAKPDGTLFVNGGETWVSPDVRILVAHQLRSRIYRFQAERFSMGQSPFGSSAVLSSNASNLPEVLNVLDTNPARFQRFNRLITEILPQVRHVSVRPVGSNQVEVLVWPLDYATEKDYLAVPLNECGSGVAQILAILYVVVTSEHPQVIIVDEPQSFLHPGAIRKLIDVLKRYPQHQYIFATHSPAVITASEPATITMVRSSETGSTLSAINRTDSNDLQLYLSEIGARLSDVFGADNILWVEGKTEEECFPRIIRTISNTPLMGTAIVGVTHTGDFSGRDRRHIFELYRKLSQANTLLPPALGFIFDQECLTSNEKSDLERLGAGLIRFLPRRMYENYLLQAQAISAVANGIPGFRDSPVQPDEVERLIDAKRSDARFYCQGLQDIPADWMCCIDVRVLREIFSELSENRVSYDKMIHSVALTVWMLQNRPDELQSLSDFLIAFLR